MRALRERRALLLLDNFEHVLPAAGEIASLLEGCQQIKVLATSREPLRLRWEREFLVGPLGLPAPGLDTDPATAARADVPERHRTLRAAVDWSYEMLAPLEQVAFRQLGVFAGGATLEALGAVVQAGTHRLELLGALVEKNLVHRVDRLEPSLRFRLLETARAFALDELATHGEETAARRRHAAYFADLAERAEAGILGAEQMHWFVRLEPELGNFRAALRWCIDQGERDLALRLGFALVAFWFPRGHFTEARDWLLELLELPEVAPRSAAGIKVVARLGGLLAFQGDGVRGGELAREALALARQVGDALLIGQAAQAVGIASLARGDLRLLHRS